MKRLLILLTVVLGCCQVVLSQSPGQPQVQIAANGLPVIIQKASNSSSGSVASLAKAFTNNTTKGNSIVVVCGVGNGTAPTVSDTQTNSFSQAIQVANGTAFNTAILYAVATAGGADTVTVNNGGTTASIAMEIYEVSGFIALSPQAVSITNSNTSAAATSSPAVPVTPLTSNEYSFVAFGLGTAAQTITVCPSSLCNYVNDSGQLNPTTPAGLFSFVSASEMLSTWLTSQPSATVGTGEPWAVAVATFKPVIFLSRLPAVDCDGEAIYDASTSGSTQLVPLVTGKVIYVCGYSFSQSTTTTVTVKLNYGTGSACATGTTAMTPGHVLQAASSTGPIGIVVMTPGYTGLRTAISNALCINTSAAVSVQGIVWYRQLIAQ